MFLKMKFNRSSFFIMVLFLNSCMTNVAFLNGNKDCINENVPQLEEIYISTSSIKNLPRYGKFHDIFIRYEEIYNNKKVYKVDKLLFMKNFFKKNNIPAKIIDVDTLKVKHNYLLIKEFKLEYDEYQKTYEGKDFFTASCLVQMEFQKENCSAEALISFVDKEEGFFYPLNATSLKDALNEFKKGILEIIRMYK